MATGITSSAPSKAVVSTQTDLIATSDTCFFDLPQELINRILEQITHLSQIHSLLSINKPLKALIEKHAPLWNDWLKKHFPGSHKEGILNPFEVFRDQQAKRKTMQSNNPIWRTLKGHGDEVSGLKTDQGKLISVGRDCCVKVWDADSGILEKSFTFAAGEKVKGMAVYKDNLYLASVSDEGVPKKITKNIKNIIPDGMIKIYNLKDENAQKYGNEIGLLEIGYFKCLCAHENLLFIAYEELIFDHGILIWDMDTNTFVQKIHLGKRSLCGGKGYNTEITCVASSKNTLFSGHESGDIFAWDLEKFKLMKKLDRSPTMSDDNDEDLNNNSSVKGLIVYEDHLISAIGRTITVMDLNQDEPYFSFDATGQVDPWCFYACDGLLFTGLDQKRIAIWDLATKKKLWERECSYLSSVAMHQGKLFIGSEKKEIDVFDFRLPYEHELKILNAKTKPELTKLRTESLLHAFAGQDRDKMIECVDKLLALDPINNQLCEYLCLATSGLLSLEHEFYENGPFDHRACLQSATFDQIEKALFDFTKWLETEKTIKVDAQFAVEDPQTRAIQELEEESGDEEPLSETELNDEAPCDDVEMQEDL